MRHWFIAGLLTITTSAIAQVDDTTTPDAVQKNTSALEDLVGAPLSIDLQVGAWLTRIDGTASNGGPGANFLNFRDGFRSLGLDELAATFRGELTVSSGEWGGRLMGAYGKWSGEANVQGATQWGGQTLTPNTPYDSSLEMSWMGFELLWNPWVAEGDGDRNTLDPLEITLGPNVGVNWLHVDQSLDTNGGTVENTGSWWTVYGGAQLAARVDLRPYTSFLHSMEVGVGGSVGSTVSNGGIFFKVRGGLALNFTPNIGAEVGYRLMEYKDLTQDVGGGRQWDLSPRFPGLFVSLNISF